jgi:2-polyprenyl-3-methyl-5-hydroxy-6-metoxy-1,4-benzoquinol methylase
MSFATTFYDGYWAHRVERGDHVAKNRIKLRHDQTAEFISRRFSETRGLKVLDLGCGDGVLGQRLATLGCELTGADVSPRALALAQPHYQSTFVLDLDSDPTPPGLGEAFDIVVCLEVLEHIQKPQMNIRRAFELCRTGGAAVFSFPNMFSWKNRWSFLRGRWPGGYTTYDPREHLQVFELPAFKKWVSDAGFRLLGTSITPDLPRWKPLRKSMFQMRGLLNELSPALWAMQINVFAEKK